MKKGKTVPSTTISKQRPVKGGGVGVPSLLKDPKKERMMRAKMKKVLEPNTKPEVDDEHGFSPLKDSALLAHLKHTFEMVQDKVTALDRAKASAKELDAALKAETFAREDKERRLRDANKKVKELEQYTADQQNHLCKLQENVQEERDAHRETKEKLSQKCADVEAMSNEASALRVQVEALQKQLTQAKLDASESDAARIKAEDSANATKMKQTAERKALARQVATLKGEFEELSESNARVIADAAAAKEKLRITESTLQQHKDNDKENARRMAAAFREAESARSELQNAAARMAGLQVEVTAGKESLSASLAEREAEKRNASVLRRKIEDALEDEKASHARTLREKDEAEKTIAKQRSDNDKMLSQLNFELEKVRDARARERARMEDDHGEEIDKIAEKVRQAERARNAVERSLKAKCGELASMKNDRDDIKDRLSAISQALKQEQKAHKATKVHLSKSKQQHESKENDYAKLAASQSAHDKKHAAFVKHAQSQLQALARDLAKVKSQANEEKKLRVEAEQKIAHSKKHGKDQIDALGKSVLELREAKVDLELLVAKHKDDAKCADEAHAAALSKVKLDAKQRVASAQKKAATVCQRAEDRIKELETQITIIKRTCNALEQDASAVRCALNSKTDELGRCKKQVAEAEEMAEKMSIKFEEAKKAGVFAVKKAKKDHANVVKKMQKQVKKILAERDRHEDSVRTAHADVERARAELDEVKGSAAGQIVGFSERTRELAEQLRDADDAKRVMQATVQKHERKLEAAQAEAEALKHALDRAQVEAEHQIKETKLMIDELVQEKDAAERELKSIKSEHEESVKKHVQELKNRSDDMESKLEGLQWQVESHRKELELCAGEKEELIEKLERVKRDNKDLRLNETKLISLYKNISMGSSGAQQQQQQQSSLDMLTPNPGIYAEHSPAPSSLELGSSRRGFRSTSDVLKYKRLEADALQTTERANVRRASFKKRKKKLVRAPRRRPGTASLLY